MFLKFFQMERINGKYAKESMKLLNGVLTLSLGQFPLADVRTIMAADELIAGINSMCSKKSLSTINFSTNKTSIIGLLEHGYGVVVVVNCRRR